VARESCKEILESKGLVFGNNQTHNEYLDNLASHKFAICPEGNGVDCHRTWECYYMGVIPILLENIFTKYLQKHLPCILLKSWDDLNENHLAQYSELSKQLERSQKYLSLSYYKKEIYINTNIFP
jgi:hypothetical protein